MNNITRKLIAICSVCLMALIFTSPPVLATPITYNWIGEGEGSMTILDPDDWLSSVVDQTHIPTILTAFDFVINPTFGLTTASSISYQFTVFGTGTLTIINQGGYQLTLNNIIGVGGPAINTSPQWTTPLGIQTQIVGVFNQTNNPAVVPEPTTIALLGLGIVGLAGAEVRRRRKKKAVDNS